MAEELVEDRMRQPCRSCWRTDGVHTAMRPPGEGEGPVGHLDGEQRARERVICSNWERRVSERVVNRAGNNSERFSNETKQLMGSAFGCASGRWPLR